MIKQPIQKSTISMSFNSFDLSAASLRAISDPAHLKPTPVQRQAQAGGGNIRGLGRSESHA
jgi:superfamily II DNA/RNA helicase